MHAAHAHKQRGRRWVDDLHALEAMRLKVPKKVTQCFDLIEREMFAGPWVQGDYSISDPYLFTLARWLEA